LNIQKNNVNMKKSVDIYRNGVFKWILDIKQLS